MLFLAALSLVRAYLLTDFQQVVGGLTSVQMGDTHVCGLNAKQEIYCAENGGFPSKINWFNVPGGLTSVDARGGRIFGAHPSGIYLSDKIGGDAKFTQLFGGLQQVSFDGTNACGITAGGRIFCSDGVTKNVGFRFVTGGLIQLVVQGTKLYGVNAGGEVWYTADWRNANWVRVAGALSQIDFDGKTLCGTNGDHNVFCANQGLESNPNWEIIPYTKLTQVSVSGNSIIGLGVDGNLYYSKFQFQ
jgi:hypothetical protein